MNLGFLIKQKFLIFEMLCSSTLFQRLVGGVAEEWLVVTMDSLSPLQPHVSG